MNPAAARAIAVFLMLWEPLTFAGELLSSLSSLEMRGVPAAAELTAHAAIAALCVAAGWALWGGNPGARKISGVAVSAGAAAEIQSLYWTWLPRNTMPGDKLPLAALIVAVAGILLLYLRRLPR